MRVFITGMEGFAGFHLARLLSRDGYEVWGTYLDSRYSSRLTNLGDRVNPVRCDITDSVLLADLIQKAAPDIIYHLAAISFVPDGGDEPGHTFKVNVMGSVNLLDSVLKLRKRPRMLLVSSGDIYGNLGPEELPVSESRAPSPVTVYGKSKYCMELIAEQYFRDFDLDIVLARSFNHTGPMQRDQFAASSFAKQISLVECGMCEPILSTGNLSAVRDFTDVRDMVTGYRALAERIGLNGVFNLCSGKGYRIGNILDILISYSSKEIIIRQEKKKMRSSDTPLLRGDNSKVVEATGWRPEIPIDRTLEDLLEWWRKVVRERKGNGISGKCVVPEGQRRL